MCVRVRTHVCGPLHNILVLIAHAQMSASKVVVGLVERMWGWGLHVGKGAHLWLGGDFNLPDITWEEESVVPYATNSAVSNQLLTIVKDLYLDQVVTEPTRITETSSSTLDLFFTSNQTLVNKVEVIPGVSDHEAVFIESSLRPMRVKTPPRKVFQYRKADYDAMKTELRSCQAEFQESAKTEDVEHLWMTFKNKVHSLMESHIPSKILRGNRVQKP